MSILPTLFNYEKTRTGLHSQKLVHKDWGLEQNQKKRLWEKFSSLFFRQGDSRLHSQLTA